MKVRSFFPLNTDYKKYSKFQKVTPNKNDENYSSGKIYSYPKNYYTNQIAFSGMGADVAIKKIGEENFPSQKILEELKKLGTSRDFSLYEIHLDYYKKLLDCKTLKEAKENYPEFSDVIDAKDINLDNLPPQNSLVRISKGKIEGICIDELSLELLKRYYGKLYSPNNKQLYFNITNIPVNRLFDILNIKRINALYVNYASVTNPKTKKLLASAVRNYYINNPQARIKKSQTSLKKWQEDDYKNKTLSAMRSVLARERLSASEKKFLEENPEYLQARRESWHRHPEITDRMSKIAKSNKLFPVVISKQISNKKLNKSDIIVLNTYYKTCNNAMPNYNKTIGAEYHRILIERGLIKD